MPCWSRRAAGRLGAETTDDGEHHRFDLTTLTKGRTCSSFHRGHGVGLRRYAWKEDAMEFGVYVNGYLPGPAAHDTASEHTMLHREAEYVIAADRSNWKYAWFGEHHSLTEYSHMSAPE